MKSWKVATPALVLASVGASISLAQSGEPTTTDWDRSPVQDIARIYYNVGSGERIVTTMRDGQTAPADAGNSVSLWSTQGPPPPCAVDAGYTTAFFFGVDNPGSTPLSTAVELVQWGDIEQNTVVDCFSVNWVVAHADTDTNLDSIGDGVEELAGQWTIWDADNGRSINRSTRLPLVQVLFTNLPGNIADPGFLSGYTLDIDLVGGFSGTDLSFEIGDSDGDCQDAAFCNSSVEDIDGVFKPIALCDRDFDGFEDADLDGDGLFDWSWSVQFFQPGIGNDFDSDGDSGVAAPTSADTIGITFGYPIGFEENDGVNWSIDTSIDDAAVGIEDVFSIYQDGLYRDSFFFGGFQCPTDMDPYVPMSTFSFQLWGPGENVCRADFNGDGTLNFFDVSAFIQDYNAGGDFNEDGQTNFFDVSAFIQEYNAGCP